MLSKWYIALEERCPPLINPAFSGKTSFGWV